VGLGYGAVALSATGGVQPYTWSISAGALPVGLTLASDGSVSGTPSSAGNFAFTIQVADSGGSTATLSGKIGIAAHLSAGLIAACATQCSVELGCVSVCGAFGQVSGGVGPYSYTQTSGQLPAGTALSGLTLTGTFKGLSGYLKFSVQITDSLGVAATVTPTFWMYPHISLSGGGCPATPPGYWNTGCSARLPYSGGTPGGRPNAKITAIGPYCTAAGCGPVPAGPPPGFSAAASGGTLSITVPGQPNNTGFDYRGVLTLVLVDQSLCSQGTKCASAGAALTVVIYGG
jgi:hypothetical protein